eukprot:6291873-Prymnesium_polylepis.1
MQQLQAGKSKGAVDGSILRHYYATWNSRRRRSYWPRLCGRSTPSPKSRCRSLQCTLSSSSSTRMVPSSPLTTPAGTSPWPDS